MALEAPPKSGRLTLPVQNGGNKYYGVNSIGYGSLGRGASKPGFFVSFLVDARGGKMHGKRHSGVDLIIPPSKVCMPTRITCKLIRKEKLIHPPVLKEGEALASRIAELGPVGEKFLGAVLIELPHFASRIDGERELIILRSENGDSWHEHQSQTPSEALIKLIENDAEVNKEKRVVRIFTADFPRYFVAVTRMRQDSKTVGSTGGVVKSSISQAAVTFPQGAIGKDIKVGLQVLPVAPEAVVSVVGQPVPMSAVTTIEPRRRKFRDPVTLSIPVSKDMQDSIRKQKKGENPAVHILYSITGGNSPSQWEDITGSAPLNLVNDAVSFSTIVSARYWLMDCRNLPIPVKSAGEIFQDVVKPPFLAKFYILAKRHSLTEAQVRVLCITDEDIESTHERQERFAIIGSTKDVEVFEGKPYYLDIAGNFKPVAASGQELVITFNSFRVNRLSFVARLVDSTHPPSAQFFLNKELVIPPGKRAESPLFSIDVSLPNFDEGLVSPDLEPEQWKAKLEAAKLSLAQDRPPVGASLKLTDIAEALQGDWVPLATQLGVSNAEVVKIQTEFGSAPEQAILMLHLWVEKMGVRATGTELERALRKIGRDDVIDQCIYNKPDIFGGVVEEQDSLNPIDSSFYHQDHPVVSENIQIPKAEVSSQPFIEVEEGVEYQVEEVWDGTQWHKTRIAVQKPEESSATPTVTDNVVTNGGEVDVSFSDKTQDIHSEHEPRDYLATLKEEDEPGLVLEEPPVEVRSTVRVQVTEGPPGYLEELQRENTEEQVQKQENQTDDKFLTGNRCDPPTSSHLEEQFHPEPMHHNINSLQFENQSSHSEVQHPTVEPALNANSELQGGSSISSVTDGEQMQQQENQPDDKLVTGNQSDPPTASHLEEQFQPEPAHHSVDNFSFEKDSSNISPVTDGADSADVEVFGDITFGDPKVTTEVEEYEETLEDGSVVKRKVIKTKQEQLVTKSFTVGSPDGAFDSIDTQQVLHHNFVDSSSSSSPGTVVLETEETLDDGTVVKRTVTKTTEQHTENP